MTLNIDGSRKRLTKRQIKLITHVLFMVFSYQLILSPAAAAALDVATDGQQPATSTEQLSVTDGYQLTDATSTEEIILEEAKPEINEDIHLPVIEEKIIIKNIGIKGISAYNVGDINQCDGDPCTSANGENICLALKMGYKRCAANFVPFGTILEIEGYGQCMVTDRMNSRYQNHVDIAMKYEQKKEALKFGRKKLEVKIIKKATQV